MRYASARYRQRVEEKAYRTYVTDALKTITENTANINGGKTIQKRFADIFYIKPDERSAEEVIDFMKEKLRKVGEKNGV